MSNVSPKGLYEAVLAKGREIRYRFSHCEVVKCVNGRIVRVSESVPAQIDPRTLSHSFGESDSFHLPIFVGPTPNEVIFPGDDDVLNFIDHRMFVGAQKRRKPPGET